MAVVDLRRVEDLPRALHKFVRAADDVALTAMRNAARWGFTQAVIKTQRSGATATRTFIQAWFSKPLARGAMVGNSAAHAVFVELGRKPGKAPPVSVIEDWLRAKGIAGKPKRLTHKQARSKAIGRGPSGNISGAKQRSRLQRDIKLRTKIYRSEPATKQRHADMIKGMAIGIAFKIAARGTKGRYILRDLAPRMGVRFWREFRQGMRQLAAVPPR